MEYKNWREDWSEADVVAELVHQLKLKAVDTRLEVRIPSGFHRSKLMRVDVSIIHMDRIIALIEVKDRPATKECKKGESSRQRKAYRHAQESLALPVLWCIGFEQVPATVQAVMGLIECR